MRELKSLILDSGMTYDYAGDDEYRLDCPNCPDHGRHFYVNVRKEVGFCHRCNFAPGRTRLYVTLFGIKPPPLRARNTKKGRQQRETPIVKHEKLKEITLPLFFTPMRAKHPYAIKRRLGDKTLRQYKIGYCDKGPYAQCMIIPYYENGVLVCYAARDMTGKRKPKYKYPKGVKQGGIVFNLDKARNYSSCIICEGALDAMRVGKNAISLGRKHMSREQESKIIEADFKIAMVMLDKDATTESMEICNRLSEHMPTYFCQLPDNVKDPDDLTADEVITIIEESERFCKELRVYKELDNLPLRKRKWPIYY